MRSKNSHLFADIELEEIRISLAEWSWLLKDEWSPLLVSAVGDVFLQNQTGQVCRLGTGAGELLFVAATVAEFYEALESPASQREWLLAPVVDELRIQGRALGQGQCYGFTILPIFQEGSYTAENRFVLSVQEHIGFTGDMHSQLQDVSDGQAVEIVLTK